MSNSENPATLLVAQSADYFAANPDVDSLVVVVGTGQFYRPEREDIAKQEAVKVQSDTLRVHRHQLAASVAVNPAAEVPQYPAVVGTVELLLCHFDLKGITARELAEVIYRAALLEGATAASAGAQMQAVADFLLDKAAEGMTVINYTAPVPETSAAETSAAETSTAETSTAETSAAETSTAETSTADASTADASTADASTADTSTADTSTTDTSAAAKPAKAKAAPKTKASTKVKAAE